MKARDFLDDDDRHNPEQDDDILFEMSNFGRSVTGLPDNIVLWVRTDLSDHGHNRYRLKVRKNREWAAIFSVGSNPILLKNLNNSLTTPEQNQVISFIRMYHTHIINLIDDKTTTDQFIMDVKKARGENKHE